MGDNGDESMPEFNVGFAEKLIVAGKFVADDDLSNAEAKRTVLYLSHLACEIILKALLEKAGKSVPKIHSTSRLLAEFDECEVLGEITKGTESWVPGKRLRGVVADEGYRNATIGNILNAEDHGASKYPNDVTYGSIGTYPRHSILPCFFAIGEKIETNV